LVASRPARIIMVLSRHGELLEQVLLIDQDLPLGHVADPHWLAEGLLGERAQAGAGQVDDHEIRVVPGRVEPQGIRLPEIRDDLATVHQHGADPHPVA